MDYSMDLAKKVIEVMESNGWGYEFDEEKGVVVTPTRLKNKLQRIRQVIAIYDDHIITRSLLPVRADDNSIQKVAEFLHRANYGLLRGNFQLDFRDGEISYFVYIDCRKEFPTTEKIEAAVLIPCAMIERYGDALTMVLFGLSTPEDAVNTAEKD